MAAMRLDLFVTCICNCMFCLSREIHKDKTCDKAWLCFGNTFIRMPKASAKHLLEKGWEF